MSRCVLIKIWQGGNYPDRKSQRYSSINRIVQVGLILALGDVQVGVFTCALAEGNLSKGGNFLDVRINRG